MFNNKYEQDFPLNDTTKGLDEHGNVYPSGLELFYHEYPYYYIWNKSAKLWKRRKSPLKSSTIGRIHIAHPKQGERYYLRILLHHVKGATSFQDLRTAKMIFNMKHIKKHVKQETYWKMIMNIIVHYKKHVVLACQVH